MRLPVLPDALDIVTRRVRTEPEEDEWGFDPGFARGAQPFLDQLFDHWWRITAEGMEHVPDRGRALIVANHAGALPWDAAMMATALRRAGKRQPRFLVLNRAFELPWASVAIRRFGGVPASPFNAIRLLEQDHAVMVFPEGGNGTGKSWSQRYRLERFGRGGFVELALRTGAPVVPCAVVGNETIRLPWLGPLGTLQLPSRWRIEFCPPVSLAQYGPDAVDDRALVLEIAEEIRKLIQSKIFENLVKREGAFR